MEEAQKRIRKWVPGEVLALDNLGLETLPPLPEGLTQLTCYTNQLTSLPPLPASLTHLWCYTNRLTCLPPLPPGLVTLICTNNKLTSLPPLPETLTVLYCHNNQLTSLPPLPPGLVKLSCDNNKLTSLPPLPAGLTHLYCDMNLTCLPNSIPQNLRMFAVIYDTIEIHKLYEFDDISKYWESVNEHVHSKARTLARTRMICEELNTVVSCHS